jgi:predicted O-methyltransferase YrrM
MHFTMSSFDEAIASLDLQLFAGIDSECTPPDKQSLLALQNAVRRIRPGYKYLEIGSYLGGSIQPHLLDERCARIYSIDKRPKQQPDARGFNHTYLNNSTQRMLAKLRALAPQQMDKLTTIDGDSRTIEPLRIPDQIDFCFIDGEHTDRAVLSDFQFCLQVLARDGCIAFHDAQITYNGLRHCLEHLKQSGREFRAYVLPLVLFVVQVGEFPLHENAEVRERLLNNHEAYLFALQNNDHYREFSNRLPFRLVRNFISRLRRTNVSQ